MLKKGPWPLLERSPFSSSCHAAYASVAASVGKGQVYADVVSFSNGLSCVRRGVLIVCDGRHPSKDDNDARCIDRQAKRILSRTVQSDAQIKDLDVSQLFFFFVATHAPFHSIPSFFPEQAPRTLGKFQSDRIRDQGRAGRAQRM